MRILVDYRPALTARTGVGEFAHELARALATSDTGVAGADEVVLFTSSWKDRPAPALFKDLPQVRIVDRRVPVRVLTWAWNRAGWPPVEWLAGPCDVVHGQSPLLIPAAHAARVVTIHDLDFLRHPERGQGEVRRDYPQLARAHAGRANAIVVSSHYAKAEVTNRLGVEPSRIHVCSPGAPQWAAIVAERQAVRRGRRILFVGSLGPRKNVGTLLEAYARLRSMTRDAPALTLAGPRTATSGDWERRAGQAPLAGHVDITGYVDSARRIELYADACMVVLPSYDEGFGLPVLEAMACGVPVVVSARGSLPEVAGPAADPVDPDDVEGLADRMAGLLDPARAAAAARRGREQASHYSWGQCASSARIAYRAAIEAHAHRG